jgi:hypothetical protein
MPHKYLERLKTLMPPLPNPPNRDVDWELAEDVYGLPFPSDFKEFVATYGNLRWCDLFAPIYPITSSRKTCVKSRELVLDYLKH